MNYYKDTTTGTVYAYDDEQVADGIVKEGLVPMTPEEVEAHLNPVYIKPLPASDDIIQITRSEWNALCVAAGVPEMQK